MYTEGRRRAWRPNPICLCGHSLGSHNRWRECIFLTDVTSASAVVCSCAQFRSAKQEAHYKQARENLRHKHFDSGLEKNVGMDLERMMLAGEIVEIQKHFPLDLFVNGRKICRHYVDFRVVYPDGRVEFVEAKGRKEATYIFKRNLMEATFLHDNPEIGYRVIR